MKHPSDDISSILDFMDLDRIKIGFVRFLKGFIAGGVAQVLMVVGLGLEFKSLAEAHTILNTLLVAFLTGGLLGIQKMISYKP